MCFVLSVCLCACLSKVFFHLSLFFYIKIKSGERSAAAQAALARLEQNNQKTKVLVFLGYVLVDYVLVDSAMKVTTQF